MPDFLSVGVGFSGVFGFGTGSSLEFQWVLHGSQASWKPALTATVAVAVGSSVDATFNVGTARYSGDVNKISRKMLNVNSFGEGDCPTYFGSLGIDDGAKIGITGTYSTQNVGGFIYGGQVNFGAGLGPGSGTIGVTNTWTLYDFVAK